MNIKVEVEGRIKRIGEIQEIGANGFQKREVIIETVSGEFDQTIKCELFKKNLDKIDGFNEGDMVLAHCNLRGREHNGQRGVAVFNTVEAWRFERVQGGSATQVQNHGSDEPPF